MGTNEQVFLWLKGVAEKGHTGEDYSCKGYNYRHIY